MSDLTRPYITLTSIRHGSRRVRVVRAPGSSGCPPTWITHDAAPSRIARSVATVFHRLCTSSRRRWNKRTHRAAPSAPFSASPHGRVSVRFTRGAKRTHCADGHSVSIGSFPVRTKPPAPRRNPTETPAAHVIYAEFDVQSPTVQQRPADERTHGAALPFNGSPQG